MSPYPLTYRLDFLATAGTLVLLAAALAFVPMWLAGVPMAALGRTFARTIRQLRLPIVTIAFILSISTIMNYSGMTSSMALALARTGVLFPFFAAWLGMIGVFLTGSDTSSNTLFGPLQATTARISGFDPVLMGATNASAGVMGKMISPQNLSVGAAGVGAVGREGEIFARVAFHSLVLTTRWGCSRCSRRTCLRGWWRDSIARRALVGSARESVSNGGRMKWIVPFLLVVAIVPLAGQSGAKNGEWTTYGADLGNTRYSPLDQINADNFSKLEIAWRFKTESLGPRPEYQFESTPLMVKGVVYSTAGTRRAVVALDAATGELMWMHSEREGERAEAAPAPALRTRPDLLDRRQGRADSLRHARLSPRRARREDRHPGSVSFGTRGVVDLKQDNDQTIDLVTGEVGLHSAPVVAGNTIIIGAAHLSGGVPRGKSNVKGYVRGFDVRTGKRMWIFHTIPRPGEFGNDTWLDDSWSYTGNTGIVGRRCRSTRSWGWPTCRSKPRPATTSAAIGTGTTCSAKASSPSI